MTSLWSRGSRHSILSIASRGSILSIGSAGSIASGLPAGSLGSVGSGGARPAVAGRPASARELAAWGIGLGLAAAIVVRLWPAAAAD